MMNEETETAAPKVIPFDSEIAALRRRIEALERREEERSDCRICG